MKNSEFKNDELIKDFKTLINYAKFTKNEVLTIISDLKLKVKELKALYIKASKVEGKMWNPFRFELKFAINEIYAWRQILKTV